MSDHARKPITTAADAGVVGARLTALLDRGDAAGAIALADEADGDAALVTQLRAYAYTEGGQQLRDRAVTERGRDLWQSLAGHAPDGGYNLANAEQALFELAVGDLGYLAAFEQEHEHLARARRGYEAIAVDEAVPDDLKLQALTNLGNSYDLMGRDLDALTVWQRALAIDANFAMAQGNIGVALAGVAAFMGEHAPTVVNEAALALDAALASSEAIVAYGGPQAFEHFRNTREQLPAPKELPAAPAVRFADSHLDWCREHELFLHVSHRCLREDVDKLDPLLFRGLNAGIDDDEQQRVKNLVDAFNSIKQAYVSARYLTWLASAHDTPLRDHLDAVLGRVAFLDTLEYARFGVRTGIAVHAFAAATNVLDQVAGFVHLYLGSVRVRDVYFRTLARRRGRGAVDVELAAKLEPTLNRGLLALCDLAADLDEATPLADLLERRHTATHRFLVVHEMLLAEERGGWLERVEWRTLGEQSTAQLQIARAALVYLARLIDINEAQIARGEKRPRMPLFLHRASEELAESE